MVHKNYRKRFNDMKLTLYQLGSSWTNVQLIQYELTADETTRWVGGIQIRLWWSRCKNTQISTFWDNFFWKKLIFLPSRARAMRLWFIKLIKNDSATSSWPYINLVDHKKIYNSSSTDLWQMGLLGEDRWGGIQILPRTEYFLQRFDFQKNVKILIFRNFHHRYP